MIEIQKNIGLACHTTFRIGGLAKFFISVKNSDELVEAVKWAQKKKVKYFVLGGGSNVLFADKGYNGLVIKLANSSFQISGQTVIATSGVLLAQLVAESLKEELNGLEWAAGVPGTLGGAIYGNAGAHGGSMADIVVSVDVFDGKEVKVLKNHELNFDYRHSIFKEKDKKDYIILATHLKLKRGNKGQSQELAKTYLLQRLSNQPKGFNAGSTFKNPEHNSAGRLIEDCGLKGKRIGDARISEKHANFIENVGEASSDDVVELVEMARDAVKNKFSVLLENEVRVVEY